MGGVTLIAGDDAAHPECGKRAAVSSSKGAKIRNFGLQGGRDGTIPVALRSVAGSAIVAEDFASIQGKDCALVLSPRLRFVLGRGGLRAVCEPRERGAAE